jgi:hypothetical protein
MDFRDKDSQPLIKWRTPEEAFEAWKACSRGRPCDYTGLSYEKLSKGSGIQWPCNDEHPEGEPRPYKSLLFPTDADYCETFGHDLMTGGVVSPEKYRANNPSGRAILKPAKYARTARTQHRGVRRVLQQLSIPREPGQPDAGDVYFGARSGHSRSEGKDQTENHRTKTPPASAGNRSLNLQTR